MKSKTTNSIIAVFILSEGEFSFEYSAVNGEGYSVVFDENGKYLATKSSETSWDDAPSLPVISEEGKYAKLVERVVYGLGKVSAQLKDPPEDSEYGNGDFDLWIDIYSSKGHFIIHAIDGQVMRET